MLKLKTRFVWEKKKHTIISELSWCNVLCRVGLFVLIFQTSSSVFVSRYLLKKELHLCWSMSVKSSTVGCLSHTIVSFSRDCWERNFNIAVINYFQNSTFWWNCSVLVFILNNKQKWKHGIPCHFHSIQKSALLKTMQSHFSHVWPIGFSTISPCLNKVKVPLITVT